MRITNHFNYESFWNNSETAKKYKIKNIPNQAARANIYNLAKNILEPIAQAFDGKIRINSGYRSPELNSKVGGSNSSQHSTGAAVDIVAISGGSNKKLFDTILSLIKNGKIVVGQLIWEYGSNACPQWCHVSLPYRKKNNIIRAVRCGGRTKYIPYSSDLKIPNNVTRVADSEIISPEIEGETPGDSSQRESGIHIVQYRNSIGERQIDNNYKKI